MKVSSVSHGDTDQIAALPSQVINSLPQADLSNLMLLASQVCGTPMAAISFNEAGHCVLSVSKGINTTSIPRATAFYANELTREGDTIVINDTTGDKFIFDNPLVSSEPHIRFFAGVVVMHNGDAVGHLFVADKKPRTFSEHELSILKSLGKQVEAILSLNLQVAELKNTEEEARTGGEQMKNIFQNAIDAVVVMDGTGVIVQWNPKAQVIFGWEAQEAIGQYFHELVIPERHRVAHTKRMKRYETQGDDAIPNKTIEIKALKRDGTEFDIALGISPTTISSNLFFINFISDITDRKLATDKLDKQKEFYENILNSLPTDIAVFDSNHKYLFVNPGAIKDEEFRKYIVGKDDFQYCEYRNRDRSIAQRRRDQFLQIKLSGKEIRWEDTIRDIEGNPITHLRRLFPVYDDNHELSMVIGFGIDITDRKIMEEKQTAMLKQLSTQNTQLIDFCNIVSHNLRAPLVNMGMLVKFIEASTDEEEQKMLISKLDPVIEHLNMTFNELVESIQIKQDLEIKYENILLTDCVQRTIEGLKTEINNSKAIIETDFEAAQKIYCPPKYLFSIFHNLISNALKYQSPKRSPVIKLKSERVDTNVILSVSDNGLGIDLEKHKENFFKIGKVFHRHPDAKGFGLFMTKTQVEAMNGQIWVESTPDVGSTFYIEFKNQDR